MELSQLAVLAAAEAVRTGLIEKEDDYSWLNLMTCREFNEDTGAYDYRLVVRAVLIDVE